MSRKRNRTDWLEAELNGNDSDSEWFTYVIGTKSGRRYCGHTFDLRQRLKRHNDGGNVSTRISWQKRSLGEIWYYIFVVGGFSTKSGSSRLESAVSKPARCTDNGKYTVMATAIATSISLLSPGLHWVVLPPEFAER